MKKFYLSILTILLALTASAQEPTGASADDPISRSLSGIIQTGSQSKFYTLTNKLYGVYVPPRYPNVLFAKDNNNHFNKSEPTGYPIGKIYDNYEAFDQSNWIKIIFPAGYNVNASDYVGKEITGRTITGQVNVASTPAGPVGIYIDVRLDKKVRSINEESTFDGYNGNTYCCANFVQQEWFFVKPKNLEYCNIHWAVYDGNNRFLVPSNSSWHGSFKVDMILWEQQTDDNSVTADDVFTEGHAYEFPAIVQFSVDNQIGLNIDPGFDGDIIINAPRPKEEEEGFDVGLAGTLPEGYRNVMVYPLRIKSDVTTSIDRAETSKEVQSVEYYDLQGRRSATPVKGFNIKSTTYSDGTVTNEKIVK